ncbi:hypothetical protein GCM10022383_04150 [Microbacterium soli]|uniref:Uncharacterized protein n=1 Tax=Microbacterium soli TaxID=446075 RepID=A0ABP7MQV2_9MICO
MRYDPVAAYELDRRWDAQADQMNTLIKELDSTTVTGLPPAARDAARTFLASWRSTAVEAKVASEVYADELRETGVLYENLDAEIARRMRALGGGA